MIFGADAEERTGDDAGVEAIEKPAGRGHSRHELHEIIHVRLPCFVRPLTKRDSNFVSGQLGENLNGRRRGLISIQPSEQRESSGDLTRPAQPLPSSGMKATPTDCGREIFETASWFGVGRTLEESRPESHAPPGRRSTRIQQCDQIITAPVGLMLRARHRGATLPDPRKSGFRCLQQALMLPLL